MTSTDGEPLTASCVYAHRLVFDRADGCAKVESNVSVSATDEAFVLRGELTAVWEQETVAAKTWQLRVPRKPQEASGELNPDTAPVAAPGPP